MPLFGSTKRTPKHVVKKLVDAVPLLARDDAKSHHVVCKNLLRMKNMICAPFTPELETDMLVSQLAQELYRTDLLLLLIQNLKSIAFESNKDVVLIFNNILIRQSEAHPSMVEYIRNKPEILFSLMAGYEQPLIALHSGRMLHECIKYKPLARVMLYSHDFFGLFHHTALPAFEIATDAFLTIKELLILHQELCAEFLELKYNIFFSYFDRLLISENYVTRRLSLALLNKLLTNHYNFEVMLKFVSNLENLKLMMTMLKDTSAHNQLEAFHIFKLFVANPDKPQEIFNILLLNQKRLVKFLAQFLPEQRDDESFVCEKKHLIELIKEL